MKNYISQIDEETRKVDFDSFDISVKELVSMAESEIIDIAPEYQRQFRWPKENESKLIESVLLGIPVPSLFMAANKDGTWELIDGVQRLNTLIHYIGNESQIEKFGLKDNLKLEGLDILTEFNGSYYSDLPQSLKLKFSLRPLKVTTLSDKSDLKVRFDLFERLNTGGVKLTSQEIRACVFRGEFNDFLAELSADENFLKVVNLPEVKNSDGTKEELILKFFAYKNSRESFEHSVVEFLNDYMESSSLKFNYRKESEVFCTTFRILAELFPSGIRRGNRKMTPINLYEAIAIGAADAIEDGSFSRPDNVIQWLNEDVDLKQLTSGATNSKLRLNSRINYCYNKFSSNVR